MASESKKVKRYQEMDTSPEDQAKPIQFPELLSFPIDILLEIIGHTDPIDVLNLARTSKGIRWVLMSKSSLGTWQRAMLNDETVPRCPPDINIPSMLSLLADSHCSHCYNEPEPDQSRYMTSLFPEVHARLCEDCMFNLLSCEVELNEKNKDFASLILECIPTLDTWWVGRTCKHHLCRTNALAFLIADRDRFLEQYRQATDKTTLVGIQKRKVLCRKEDSPKWKRWSGFIHAKQRGDYKTIVDGRASEISYKLRHKGYSRELDYLKRFEADKIALPRFPEAPGVCYLSDHPLVNTIRMLTEQEWTRIEPQMVAFAEMLEVHRAARDRKCLQKKRAAIALQLYREEIQKLSPEALTPSLADLLEWTPVQDIIQRTDTYWNFFTEKIKLRDLYKDRLSSFIDQFQTQELRRFVAKTPHALSLASRLSSTECIKTLKLAMTVFTCNCSTHEDHPMVDGRNDPNNMPLFYPEFIHHMCNSVEYHDCEEVDCEDFQTPGHLKRQQFRRNETDHEDFRDESNWFERQAFWLMTVEEEFGECYGRIQWTSDELSFDYRAQAVVKRVITACGRNPDITTVAEMDGLDPRLVCLKCTFGHEPDGERVCTVFTWRSAVQHCLKKHWGNSTVYWRMISFEDVATARLLEKTEDEEYYNSHLERMWRCSACRNDTDDPGRMNLAALKHHSQERHDTSNFRFGKEYYKAVDAPPPQPKVAVRMKPRAAQGV